MAIVFAFCIFGTNALNAQDWTISAKSKEGAFVGADFEFAPGWSIAAIGGYQWYFYDKPHFHLGVRLMGRVGYSYSSYDYPFSSYSIDYHTVGIRVAPQFIWDFLSIGKHTLGWNIAPIGLGANIVTTSISYKNGIGASGASSTSATAAAFAYEFSTGLHYYYDIKHQAYLSIRWGGIGGWIGAGYAYKF
ncbi:hypothetical protein [Helicobacter sp. 23-1045]